MEELCVYTRMKPQYLYKLTSKNKIPYYKPRGKILYFKKSEIDAWMLNGKFKNIPNNERIKESDIELCLINIIGAMNLCADTIKAHTNKLQLQLEKIQNNRIMENK